MNKKIITFIYCLFFIISMGNSQITSNDSIRINELTFDFAIPDLPAFNALNIETNSILRPTTAKEFSVISNEFFNGNNLIIPKTLAVEFSPMLIVSSQSNTLNKYQKNKILYNTRISIGAITDDNNFSRLAIGLRTTLIDKGDIKRDKSSVNPFFNLIKKKNKLREQYYDKIGIDGSQTETEMIQIDEHFEKNIMTRNFKMLKDSIEKENWNADRLDVAVAVIGASPDSLAKNINLDSFIFWVTYAKKAGSLGQFLFGLNTENYMFENNLYTNIRLPARFYIGSRKLKGFIEGEYSYMQQESLNNLIGDIGIEYNIYKSYWIEFKAGLKKDFNNNSSNFVSDFKIVYTLPDKL